MDGGGEVNFVLFPSIAIILQMKNIHTCNSCILSCISFCRV